MKKKVFVVECPGYDQTEEKIAQLLGMMGGIEQFVKPGQKIVLKPNLLAAAEPEKAVTTHPSVVAATARQVKKITGDILLVDSPGSGYSYDKKTLEKTYRVCEMDKAASAAGIRLNDDTTYETVSYSDGKLVKRFEVLTPVAHCDGYINLCKFKTHALMYLTGAVKNIFGLIPGRIKPGYHSTMPNNDLFAGVLLDLATMMPPVLTIMDAVVGMEGDGPFNGTPCQIGYLIASTDLLAIDLLMSEMAGIPVENNPLLTEAKKRGMYPASMDDVEVVGVPLEKLKLKEYKLPGSYSTHDHSSLGKGNLLMGLVKSGYTVEPRVKASACTACGACKKACPRDAIQIINNVSVIDKTKCIRCYCCHEMCRYNAIELHRSFLYRVASRIG